MPQAQHNLLMAGVRSSGEGWKAPPIPSAAFNGNPADRDWIDGQTTMQPLQTFEQPLELSDGLERIGRVVFIRATNFVDGAPFPPFHEKARARGWETHEIACGHDVMLDEPEALARLLVEAAR